MNSPTKLERFRGCLIGLLIGDAIGAPFEGLPAGFIYDSFGLGKDIVSKPPVEELFYTDDTQMMISVAETLTKHGEIITETLCRNFVDNYEENRGYGAGCQKILDTMATGGDWQTLTNTLFPGGSYGNGAAMRVAPLGLMFSNDKETLKKQVNLSAIPTHVHPLGIEGAVLIAAAIAHVVREPVFNRQAFYADLKTCVSEEEYHWLLSVAENLEPGNTLLASLGSSLEAHRSVVTAIACFSIEPDSYENVIGRAISLGDDTDTVAAMAGAICGAHLGIQAIPQHLIDMCENGPKGIGYIDKLANQLYEHIIQ